jgi:proteasome beta subunit
MASDPQTAHKVTKVFKLQSCPVVWTASGSIYVIEEVTAALAGIDQPTTAFTEPNLTALRERLRAHIHKTMKKCYGSALSASPFPDGAIPGSFATSFLVAGYANQTPWLLEVAHDGQLNWHTEFGFYAIGSGGSFARVAHGLMAHYLSTQLTLKQGLQVAYRAIETTCEVSPGGVGMPVRIALVDSSGARILETGEINQIGDMVARWKTLEAETLTMDAEEAKMSAEGDLPVMETLDS